MSKVTHNILPNFGQLDKDEEEKKIDTMFAWIGATSIEDFELEDREKVMKAISGYKTSHYIPGPFKLKSKNEKGEPEFEFWRKNHDYSGETFQEKVKRRLKRLQKSLDKEEAAEIEKLIKSVSKESK